MAVQVRIDCYIVSKCNRYNRLSLYFILYILKISKLIMSETNCLLKLLRSFISQEGFKYHHAEPGYVMLIYWIPDEPCMLPASPSHQIGVGGFVINDQKEV